MTSGLRCAELKEFGRTRAPWITTLVIICVVIVISERVPSALAQEGPPKATSAASDWPQWRGPKRAGIWPESGIMTTFPADAMAPEWRVAIGPGYSGPAVAGGRVFITDRQADRDVERVLAFNQATGQPLWKHEYPAKYENVDYASGPRATPTIDGDRVYTKGAMGHLFCLSATNGNVIWSHDLVARFGTRIPTWGMAGAPLIDGDALIVNVGGLPAASLVAFDKRTGAVKWQVLDDRPGYAPPVIIQSGGIRQLIFWSAEAVNSLDPETGSSFWRLPFKDGADMTICTPLLHQGHLFVSSYYGGSMMLKLTENPPSATVLWQEARGETMKLALCISTPLFKDQHFYAVDRSGLLRCLEVATGKLVWETPDATGGKDHGNVHITPAGPQEFLFSENGDLLITELNPAGYTELSRTRLIAPTKGVADERPVVWSHPAYANRHIFIRNDEELRSISLAARPK